MSRLHRVLGALRIPCPLCAVEVWLWHRYVRKQLMAAVDLDDDSILEWLRATSKPVADIEDAVD